MTEPHDSEFIFEQKCNGHFWRVRLCDFKGQDVVSIWPWFKDKQGNKYPCKAEYIKDGLRMPPERLWELGEAIAAAKAEIDSSGA
jgi:hypothetical protein